MHLSASELGRSSLCHGWVEEARECPDRPGDEALEGQMLHEQMVRKEPATGILTGEQLEMLSRCQALAGEVYETCPWHQHELQLEMPLGRHVLSGRIDLIGREESTLILYDWKFGWGSLPPTATSLQAKAYALLALSNYEDCSEAVIRIYQPRLEERHEFSLFRKDVEKLASEIRAILEAVSKTGAERTPGEEQCRWCPAYFKCPALRAAIRTIPMDVEDISECNRALELADLCESWARKVKAKCKTMALKDGTLFPGWEVVSQRQPRRVASVEKLYLAVEDLMTPADILAHSDVRVLALEKEYAERLKSKSGLAVYKGKKVFQEKTEPALAPRREHAVFRRVKHGDESFRERPSKVGGPSAGELQPGGGGRKGAKGRIGAPRTPELLAPEEA